MNPEIWQRIRNGDAAAMRSLYQDCYQELYAFGFRMLADKDKIKDCLHEVFCEIWQIRDTIGEVTHIKAYLKVCLRNKLLKQIKQDQRIESLTDDVNLPQLAQSSYEQLLIESESDADKKIKLWQALELLTPAQREVIKLKFFDELTYEAIAIVLKLKPRTVYNHIYAAICVLRKALKS